MNDSTPPASPAAALAAGGGAPAPAAVDEPDRPTGPLTHRQIVTILIGLMMGMFLAALDQTIVATAIRTIADDLKGLNHQAWATTAYLITATIVTPLYGKLGDIYGRKRLFIIAISIFIFGSILCTFATSMFSLAAFRAVQGLGAGGLFSLALAIIGDIVPPRERAKYQGYFLAVFGTASVLGPVIGGFFAGQETILGIDGWRWVFLVNVPIGIAALAVVSKTLHLRHNRLDHRIDWAGAALLSVALVPLLLVAEQGREWGWVDSKSTACYVIGVLGVIGFFWQEWRMKDEAILPLKMFTNKTVGVSSVASVLIGVAMFGGLAALPLYLQIVKGATPTEAGLLLLPMTLGIMFGSILSGQIISRTGRYRKFPIIGSALLAVSLFVFHYVAFDTPLWQTMIVMLAFGMGLGFNFQPLTLAVQNAVPPTADRCRHLDGHLHPPDRWGARHRRVPVDPVLHGGREDHRGAAGRRSHRRLPGRVGRPGERRGGRAAQGRSGQRGWGRQWCAAGQLVPQRARRAHREAVPHGLLRGDGHRVPRRLDRHGGRLPRDADAAARRAAQGLVVRRPRQGRVGRRGRGRAPR